jgi:membrane protein implicated in regulation of membrane protease activity
MKLEYYKPPKFFKLWTTVIWGILIFACILFLFLVYKGSLLALVAWSYMSIASLLLWDLYHNFLPDMEKRSKEIHELEAERAKLYKKIISEN